VEQAFKNVMSLPKIGGRIIIHTMANNCFAMAYTNSVQNYSIGFLVQRMVTLSNV